MENPFKFGTNHSHTHLRGAQRLLSFFNPSYVASPYFLLLTPYSLLLTSYSLLLTPLLLYPFTNYHNSHYFIYYLLLFSISLLLFSFYPQKRSKSTVAPHFGVTRTFLKNRLRLLNQPLCHSYVSKLSTSSREYFLLYLRTSALPSKCFHTSSNNCSAIPS